MAVACGSELSLGATFMRETATPGTYAPVAKVIEFPQLDFSAETKECQDPEAEALVNGFISHFKTGRKDAGEASITLAWVSGDTSQEDLYNDFLSDNEVKYRLQHPDDNSTTIDFTALVTGWGQALPYNDRITRTVKLRIQGQPVFS